MMTKEDLNAINALPLVDVLRWWERVPVKMSKQRTSARFLCPWHDDHHPSLLVDVQRRGTNKDLGFKCMTCKVEGFGAIQLAARLMGKSNGQLSKKDYKEVVEELVRRSGIQLQGKSYDNVQLRNSVLSHKDFAAAFPQYVGWDTTTPIYERQQWTAEHLQALGFRVELATRKATSNISEDEIQVGDLVTQFHVDTGEPLYRCSLDKGFYRGPAKAETMTLNEWGDLIQQLFNCVPVSSFITTITPEKGGKAVLVIRSTPSYPVFVFHYPWGIKKYEPRTSRNGEKWTWWALSSDADLEHRIYADANLADALSIPSLPLDTKHVSPVSHGIRHETSDAQSQQGDTRRFRRIVLCSGPRDAMQVYAHTDDAHVCWLHSETAGFDGKAGTMRPNRWLRSLLKRLRDLTVEGGLYVCYDEDATGLKASRAIALAAPFVRWLRLPKEMTDIEGCKDVTDFVTRFSQVEALLPADLQHDDPAEWFDNALFDTPTTQFWQWESERKDADGTGRARYKFDLRNLPVFLAARGMVRKTVQQDKTSFSRFFLLGNDHTYAECFPGERGANKLVTLSRDLMAEWLRAHREYNDPKGALSRAVFSAKLEQSTLEAVEIGRFDDKSFGEDFDHFFFKNTAVRVTKDEIVAVPYDSMRQWTNREAILDGRFSEVPQAWRVVVNPQYDEERRKHEELLRSLHTAEERAQENMRFDAWTSLWKFRLIMDRPLEEMPVHFRFLYNTGRIFWEKEDLGEQLSPSERQMQDMYFIAAAHAIGSALVRFRTSSRQQFVHITDNGTRREDLASGGTGKTAILELLSLMRKVLRIDGKSLEGSNITLTQELAKVVPGLHSIVAIDELPQGFSPKMLYNLTLSLTARGLYRESVVLEGDDLPKFVVASNEQLDLSSDSTLRRTYQLLVSDFYHPRSLDGSRPAHTPADDFRAMGAKEVARNLPASLLNEARNMLLACVQFFFQQPDETIRPPKDARALLRQALAASKDEQFTRWAAEFFAEERHHNCYLSIDEVAISLLDYCGISVGAKTIAAARKRFLSRIKDWLRTYRQYVVNPSPALNTATDRTTMRNGAIGYHRGSAWVTPLDPDGVPLRDENGERLPRIIRRGCYCIYICRADSAPIQPYSPDHHGDLRYVQPLPATDPERQEGGGQ